MAETEETKPIVDQTHPPVEHQFKPGESGNPKGRTKGTKNLATIIRELEGEDFDWSLVPIKQKDIAQKIGSPWRAIVYTAIAAAYSGNVKAMEWLRKSGYGDKLDVTSAGRAILTPAIISVIGPRNAEPQAETTDGS